ncbi:MAG: MMPL family transporter, partial [Myxococcales bacterium]|nr:MMPL family transporter [Myxococcales bacterium]
LNRPTIPRQNPVAQFLTPDHRVARVNVMLADLGAQGTIALGDQIRTHLESEFDGVAPVEVVLTGDAYVNARGLDAVIVDLVKSLGLAVVIIFGFLTLLFRSFRFGLLSVPPNVMPLVVTMAYMAIRGIRLNTATAMIFSISIGLAVDATIHLLARFKEEREENPHLEEAMIAASRGAGRAIVVTCVMLMAGFSVMLISSFVPVRRFGELTAVTAFGTLLGNLVVLPALLKVAGGPLTKGPGSEEAVPKEV